MKAQRKKRNRTKTKNQEYVEKEFSPKRREEILALIKGLAESLCEAEGMEMVHIEYQRETGGRILRLYIDKPGGVTLDDCVHISRQLSDLLDVNLENSGSYNLEVSSPGFDRPLGKLADFDRFKGNAARIKTIKAVEGQKKFKGILLGTSEGIVKLLVDGKTVAIPFQEITRARLINYNGENRCL